MALDPKPSWMDEILEHFKTGKIPEERLEQIKLTRKVAQYYYDEKAEILYK